MSPSTRLLRGILLMIPCALPAIAAASAPAQATSQPAPRTWTVLADPGNPVGFQLLADQKLIGNLNLIGWTPNWGWADLAPRRGDSDGRFRALASLSVNKAAGKVIGISLRVTQDGPRSITFHYDLTSNKDVPLTLLTALLGFDKSLGGQVAAMSAGKESTMKLPLARGVLPDVSKATYQIPDFGPITVSADPAVALGYDQDSRFVLAEDQYQAGARSVALTFLFPGDVSLLTTAAQIEGYTKTVAGPDWFPFATNSAAFDIGPTVIGMEGWLEAPAGGHGGVRMAGDKFQFADGSPVKFWGTNLAYGWNCAPEKRAADFTAARLARFGVNAVRLHKFSYPPGDGIGDAHDSTQWDPRGLDRLDYFSAQLKRRGVYFGWSHTFGFHVRPGDRPRLAAYDEIVKAHPDGNTYALINFAPDVQDLMIEKVVNLLKHKNPYTNLTYADEPALSFIELQNEDDIFFYSSMNAFAGCPTYKKLFVQRFSDWLKMKYASDDAMKKAWGAALKDDESLAARNVVPELNPWMFGADHLPQTRDGERRRLLDTAAFLHETQNTFYGRFLQAIRDAGYKGPVDGSPWQAPAMLPHYYNLRSDDLVGYIDRHNYFGGGLADTMLAKPGSGLLSTGLQQVIDRPFGCSEWITVYPSLYSAEGPALMAAYGMGLQGWDASYEFQSQTGTREFDPLAGWLPWGVWNADTPTQIGQYPALARMIDRGDVQEAPVISVRRVSPQDLAEGKFSFSDTVAQTADVKSFGGSVPAEALAAGRVVVEFTAATQPSTFPDMAKYRKGKVITSATGQLAWDYSADDAGQGFFTINTDGTKALVGFAQGQEAVLGNVRIRMNCPYASIILTALDKTSNLANTRGALLTAVARSSNSGFKYLQTDGKIIDNGKEPILLEPVKATITITGRDIAAVNVLDHDGRRTNRTLPVHAGAFDIDGAVDKTLYYEVLFH